MTTSADLDLARAAFDRRAWTEVAERLREADAERELEIEDLERLSVAVHMLGRSDESQRILERAHLAALRAGDLAAYARAIERRGFFGRGKLRALRGRDSSAVALPQRGYVLNCRKARIVGRVARRLGVAGEDRS